MPKNLQVNKNKVISFLAILVIGLTLLNIYNTILINQLRRTGTQARVCLKGFQLYLYYNQGVKINLDRFYEDAVKWVDDPQYQVDGLTGEQ